MAVGTALQTSYCFSFMRRGKGGSGTPSAAKEEGAAAAVSPTEQSAAAAAATKAEQQAAQSTDAAANPYESSIRTIATVSTVESFWEVYNYLKRPADLPTTTDYHFFRGGIKPTWEDPGNAKGGKWIIRLPKGVASRYWEEMILALIGGQLFQIPDGEICGAVLSVRYAEDILGVWNRTASDREIVERIRDAIKKCLQLPPHANMEYKPHTTSIADRSSFRNTQVWKPKSLEGRSMSVGEVGMGGAPSVAAAAAAATSSTMMMSEGNLPPLATDGNSNNTTSSSGGGVGRGSGPPRRSTWVTNDGLGGVGGGERGGGGRGRGVSTGGRWRNPN